MMTDPLDRLEETQDFAVGDEKGMVILKMRRTNGDQVYTLHDPQAAVEIAESIAKAAYHAKYGKPSPMVNTLKDEVLLKKRGILVTRCTHVINSMLANGKSNQDIINTIVDIVLGEVT